jgi:hypothetical protein
MFRPIRGDGTSLLVLSVDRSGSPVQCEFRLVRLTAWLPASMCGPLAFVVWRHGFRMCEQRKCLWGDSKEPNTPGYVH